MGKASQAKKAAREARESGRRPERAKRRWGYPLAVALAVVLGVLAVWYARRPVTQPTANLVTPAVQTPDGADGTTVTSVAGAGVAPSTSVAP